jgi:hypothetical protein
MHPVPMLKRVLFKKLTGKFPRRSFSCKMNKVMPAMIIGTNYWTRRWYLLIHKHNLYSLCDYLVYCIVVKYCACASCMLEILQYVYMSGNDAHVSLVNIFWHWSVMEILFWSNQNGFTIDWRSLIPWVFTEYALLQASYIPVIQNKYYDDIYIYSKINRWKLFYRIAQKSRRVKAFQYISFVTLHIQWII